MSNREKLTLSDIAAGRYTPKSTDYDFRVLKGCNYDHIPEVRHEFNTFYSSKVEVDISANERVSVETIAQYVMDMRRTWTLRAFKFDGELVMVTQNGGREGDDWSYSHIFDQDLYLEMCRHINDLCVVKLAKVETREEVSKPIPPDTADLYEFYGHNARYSVGPYD